MPETVALTKEEIIANMIFAALTAIPELIKIIQESQAANKEELLARIKTAQESWPVWE